MDQNNPPPDGTPENDPFYTPDPSAGTTTGERTDTGMPAVAAAPGKVLLILGVIVLFLIFMLYQLFVKGDGNDVPTEPPVRDIVKEAPPPEIPDINGDVGTPPPPTITPPDIPDPNGAEVLQPKDDGPTNELLRQRIRSSMTIYTNKGLLSDLANGGDETSEDSNLAFASGVFKSNTKAAKQKATHIGNLERVVAQGKLIHAVLETVINTDLPGPVRAIVSRDIFPESGRYPIIPKGSRLIGTYNSNIAGGQKRVYVVWTRVIRPDGVDVMVNSPMIDAIGQAGAPGQVDNKFAEIFSRALLTSVVAIGVGLAADKINGNEQSTTTTSSFGTTQSSDASTAATLDSVSKFGAAMQQYLARFINIKATIIVDQGTPVNVFVNRDLLFPQSYAGARVVD